VENVCIELIPRHYAGRINVDLCYCALYDTMSAIVTMIISAAYRQPAVAASIVPTGLDVEMRELRKTGTADVADPRNCHSNTCCSGQRLT
jgi:hypothetical protein